MLPINIVASLLNSLGFIQRSFGYSFSKGDTIYIAYIMLLNIIVSMGIFYIVAGVKKLDQLSIQIAFKIMTEI